MSTRQESMRKNLGLISEFILKLSQAGFKDEWYQEVISSKENKLATDIVKLLRGDYKLVEEFPFFDMDPYQAEKISGVMEEILSSKGLRFDDSNKQETAFWNLVKSSSPVVDPFEMKIHGAELTRDQDKDTFDKLGGEKKIVFETKEQALVALVLTIKIEYRDGKTNVVHYLDYKGRLCFICVRWSYSMKRWVCSTGGTHHMYWDSGVRIFTRLRFRY